MSAVESRTSWLGSRDVGAGGAGGAGAASAGALGFVVVLLVLVRATSFESMILRVTVELVSPRRVCACWHALDASSSCTQGNGRGGKKMS